MPLINLGIDNYLEFVYSDCCKTRHLTQDGREMGARFEIGTSRM